MVALGEPSSVRILVTCGGKWVGMVQALREAAAAHAGLGAEVFVADRDAVTPAGYFSDGSWQVPAISDPRYIESLLELCDRETVTALVPLIDVDLIRLAPHARSFAQCGTRLVAPLPEIAELCLDKVTFAKFCVENNIAHPAVRVPEEFAPSDFPIICKPRRGFGSIGFAVVASLQEALVQQESNPELMFQELVSAPELSVDGYINAAGECVVLVPRVREKVVGGEAQRSVTVPLGESWELARHTCLALASRGYRGPINVQILAGETPVVLEVNPRLGSCSVLSNAATSGRLLRALISESLGKVVAGDPTDYEVGLSVYRFTGDVFYRGNEVVASAPSKSGRL